MVGYLNFLNHYTATIKHQIRSNVPFEIIASEDHFQIPLLVPVTIIAPYIKTLLNHNYVREFCIIK